MSGFIFETLMRLKREHEELLSDLKTRPKEYARVSSQLIKILKEINELSDSVKSEEPKEEAQSSLCPACVDGIVGYLEGRLRKEAEEKRNGKIVDEH